MKWSWKIGRFLGIGIYMHWTFLLLLAWLVFLHITRGDSLSTTIEGTVFVLAIFGCVVLHEFGHALAARQFGIPTRDITLLPIGGVARIERIPERPSQELWIAVAGPLVNVGIAFILFVILLITGSFGTATDLMHIGGHFLAKLMWVNITLVIFNMIPAFPMDGGRVLRALLATSLDHVRATQIASSIGQLIAMGFGLLGLFYNPLLIFIALFVYLGASQEAHAAAARAILRGIPVRDAMVRRFVTLRADDTIQSAVNELLAGSQQDFPVIDDNGVIGLLTRDSIVRALNESRMGDPVTEHMTRDCLTVSDSDLLDDVLTRMRDHKCSSLAVVRSGELVGMLTMENIGELMMINSALQQSRARSDIENIYALR